MMWLNNTLLQKKAGWKCMKDMWSVSSSLLSADKASTGVLYSIVGIILSEKIKQNNWWEISAEW